MRKSGEEIDARNGVACACAWHGKCTKITPARAEGVPNYRAAAHVTEPTILSSCASHLFNEDCSVHGLKLSPLLVCDISFDSAAPSEGPRLIPNGPISSEYTLVRATYCKSKSITASAPSEAHLKGEATSFNRLRHVRKSRYALCDLHPPKRRAHIEVCCSVLVPRVGTRLQPTSAFVRAQTYRISATAPIHLLTHWYCSSSPAVSASWPSHRGLIKLFSGVSSPILSAGATAPPSRDCWCCQCLLCPPTLCSHQLRSPSPHCSTLRLSLPSHPHLPVHVPTPISPRCFVHACPLYAT